MATQDYFGAKSTFETGSGPATIYRLDALQKSGVADISRLPFSIKVLLEAALRQAGIEHETHLYARGGHGFGVRQAEGTLALWPSLALAWIRAQTPDPGADAASRAAVPDPARN